MESMQTRTTRPAKHKSLLIALLVAFLIAAALTAYLTFVAVRDLVASWEVTNLPGVPVINDSVQPPPDAEGNAPVIDDPDTPLQAAGPTPEPWDGANRVTVLVMGLDYRDWQTGEGAPRTDSMVLLTLDPINHTAGMLSIPRDLWVSIPGGFDYERVNMAYRLGEIYKYPDGGGPGLAMDTVEELLGVPVDYYAQVDFNAFVRFIDEIGGVKIDVTEEITVDPLGDNNTKKIKPGRQTLPGDLALAYARARKNAGDDFGRAQRLQQVILGVRDRIISFDMLPTLIAKSGALYNELSSGVNTNLTLDEVIRLAWTAIQVPEENIKQGVIAPPNMVTLETAANGDQILKPITDQIRLLRDEIFTDTGPASPAAAGLDLTQLVQAEKARVTVLNGSATAGLAARTSDYLKGQGVNVTNADNAATYSTYTEITFYTGKPYTVKYLVELMQINDLRIHHTYDPTSPVDVVVTVGDDWAANNPMP